MTDETETSAETPEETSAETSAETREVSKYRRLTISQWEQIVVLWELGKATVEDLSVMFGVSTVSIRKGLKKRGAVKGIRSHEIAASAVEAAKSDAQKNMERIAQMKERFINYTDLIAKLTIKELSDATKGGVPLSTKRHDLQTLQRAASIISTVRNENYHLLGLYDENTITDELPEVGITEYTADEIEKIQRGFDEVEETIGDVDEFDEDDLRLPFGDEDEEAD